MSYAERLVRNHSPGIRGLAGTPLTSWLEAAGIALMLALAVVGGSALPHRTPNLDLPRRKEAVLRIEDTLGEIPVVKFSLNQQAVGWFAIDTGSAHNVIEAGLAKRLNLVQGPCLRRDGSPARLPDGSPAQSVTLRSATAGGFRFRNAACVVMNWLRSSHLNRIDGILGMPVLESSAMLIDQDRRQLVLWYPGGLSQADVRQAGFSHPLEVSLEQLPRDNRLALPVQFEGRVGGKLMLDTGATWTLIPRLWADRLRLEPHTTGQSSTLSGMPLRHLAPVQGIAVDGTEMALARSSLVAYPADPKEKVQPLLGISTLSRYRVLLDFPRRKLYLQPRANRKAVASHRASALGALPLTTTLRAGTGR